MWLIRSIFVAGRIGLPRFASSVPRNTVSLRPVHSRFCVRYFNKQAKSRNPPVKRRVQTNRASKTQLNPITLGMEPLPEDADDDTREVSGHSFYLSYII